MFSHSDAGSIPATSTGRTEYGVVGEPRTQGVSRPLVVKQVCTACGRDQVSTNGIRVHGRAGRCGLRYRTRKTINANSNEKRLAKVLQFPSRKAVDNRKVEVPALKIAA